MNSAACWQRMYRHGYWRDGAVLASAMSGVDIALWDIRGKALEQPIASVLGGAVRDRIRLYANIGLSTDAGELGSRARRAVEQGYHAVKFYPLPAVAVLEGPASVNAVVECCETVRAVLGDDRDFAVDFHGRTTAAMAVVFERAIRDTRPLWIEEPVPPDDPHGLRTCADKFITPIAVGERCHGRTDFIRLLEERSVAVIQPDVANVGGITVAAQLASLAEAYNVVFAPHNPNGPVQTLASMHLAANAQSFAMLEHRPDSDSRMSAIASFVPAVGEGGYATVPNSSGLGTEIVIDDDQEPLTPTWMPESIRADGSFGEW